MVRLLSNLLERLRPRRLPDFDLYAQAVVAAELEALNPTGELEEVLGPEAALERAALAPVTGLGPEVVELPAGDVESFAIDFVGWSGHRRHYYSSEAVFAGLDPRVAANLRAAAEPGSFWLDRGRPGIVFRGAGRDATHVRPRGGEDSTILVDRHRGFVRLENLTVHCASRKGVFFGLEHKGRPVVPEFRLEMADAAVVADRPLDGSRFSTVWALFGYQSDVVLERVRIDHRFGAEHASYWHGFAFLGLVWRQVEVVSVGSEGCKVANRPRECDWVATATILLEDCKIADWFQEGSWRGGGGAVFQGTGVRRITVRRCLFRGNAGQRSRCLMIDNGGDPDGPGPLGEYYSAVDGRVGSGPANGPVVVRACGFFTGPGVGTELAIAMRVGNYAGSNEPCVVSLLVVDSAFVGERTQLQLSNVPAGNLRVERNNTPAILDLCRRLGLPSSPETYIPLRDRLALVSEGLIR